METGAKTVLIVDDNPNFSWVWREHCESEGYRAITAESAPEALRLLERGERVDLVVTDLMMPGMSGYEFVVRLRALEPSRTVPVLMLTGSSKLVHDLAEKEGAELLSKTVGAPQIARRIREALEPEAARAPVPVASVEPDLPPFQIVRTYYVGMLPQQSVMPPSRPEPDPAAGA